MDDERDEAQDLAAAEADFHICIFPHLDQFMVIDLRNAAAPSLRMVPVREFVTEEYYRQVEDAFRTLLREEGPLIANLMSLPTRVQALMQEAGVAHLSKLVAGEAAGSAKIALFLAAGPVLQLGREELANAGKSFFGDKFPAAFVEECHAVFLRMLDQERQVVLTQERDALRRAMIGDSDQFYTLWQNKG